MGGATILAAMPWSPGDSSARAVVVSLLWCTPVLCAACALLGDRPSLDTTRAVVLTAVLAPVGGFINAIVCYIVSTLLQGGDPTRDILVVTLFAIPFGGIPGLFFGMPLGYGTWASRRVRALPPGTGGASAALVAGMAAVTILVALVGLASAQHSLRPSPVRALLAVGALGCLWYALRDLLDLVRLRRLRRDRVSARKMKTGEPLEGIERIVPWFGRATLDTVLWRSGAHGLGAYRRAEREVPVAVLSGTPREVVRRLAIGAVVMVVLAGGLCLIAAEPAGRFVGSLFL
jgi:hypothetical protein